MSLHIPIVVLNAALAKLVQALAHILGICVDSGANLAE